MSITEPGTIPPPIKLADAGGNARHHRFGNTTERHRAADPSTRECVDFGGVRGRAPNRRAA